MKIIMQDEISVFLNGHKLIHPESDIEGIIA